MAQAKAVPEVLVFRGTVVQTPSYGRLDIFEDRLLAIKGGKVVKFTDGANEASALEKLQVGPDCVRRLKGGEFLIPGFIDTHVHAPQYKFTGTGTDVPLMDWLKKYTFPVECSFKDSAAAVHRYALLVKRFLGCGTTTATYFGTLHLEPNKILVDMIHRFGQRAVVGKVNMDRESPDSYMEPTDQGLREAEEFIQYTRAKASTRIYPCITPRFIPTCTFPMMKGLAALARKYECHIQSHISECCGEVAFVKHLHPEYSSDAAVFDEMGLLTKKTIMAHGTLLSDSEIKYLAAKGTSVSHCPLSNFFLGDAMFRVNNAMRLGLTVGLGTDVAGGISPSMLTSMRMAVVNSRAVRAHKLAIQGGLEVTPEMEKDVITFKEALYLATVGGAKALSIDHQVGLLTEGYEFDALLVNVNVPGSPLDIFEGESVAEQVEKFMNLGDDRNLVEVYVQGVLVKQGDNFTGEFALIDDHAASVANGCTSTAHTPAATATATAVEKDQDKDHSKDESRQEKRPRIAA